VPTVGAGAVLRLTSGARICTRSNLGGDKIVATVQEPVSGTNGAVIPAGSKVVLEVASISGGDTPSATHIAFRARSVAVGDASYPATGDAVSTDSLERTKVPGQKTDTKKVIGGAIAGAILGHAVGKDAKGTIIGAAAGAAAGKAADVATQKYQACLPAGATIRLTLAEPLVMATR
jgi:hypothetical protein